jgi:hypothetical protein
MRIEKRVRVAVAVASFALVAATAGYAQFGLGTIVYDPTSVGKLVQQLAQMEQQYSQLVQANAKINAQYNQMLWMATAISGNRLANYRAWPTLWSTSSATNTYGTTGGWIITRA